MNKACIYHEGAYYNLNAFHRIVRVNGGYLLQIAHVNVRSDRAEYITITSVNSGSEAYAKVKDYTS